ncbi:unnamed protein product, partial [Prorocentrum cordatum]
DSASSVLRFDPASGRAEAVGEVGAGPHKWAGGVLAEDGNIYCMPWNHTQVLRIDPSACSLSLLSLESMPPSPRAWRSTCSRRSSRLVFSQPAKVGARRRGHRSRRAQVARRRPRGQRPHLRRAVDCKWSGAVLAGNGMSRGGRRRYRVPPREDPETNSTALLGDFGEGKRKWRGAVLGDDGLASADCIPYNALEVLCIDPFTDALTTFGMAGGVRCKWRGGVVANDGNIYCAPDCADAVLCIEPAARRLSTFGTLGSGKWKWRGCALGGDGFVYCAPYEFGRTTLVVNPHCRTVHQVPSMSFDNFRLAGMVANKEDGVLVVPLS